MDSPSTECLTPSQIEELLSSTVVAEGQLPANAHLAMCARCREELEEQRRFAHLREEFARLPASAQGAIAPVLPGYEVLRWLGRGGCADVWLARHIELNLQRALKVRTCSPGYSNECPISHALLPNARKRPSSFPFSLGKPDQIEGHSRRYNDEYHYEDQQRFLKSFLSKEKAEAYRKELESRSHRFSEEMFSIVESLVEMED
jgi:hypothetical protein